MEGFLQNELNQFESYSYNIEVCMYDSSTGAKSRAPYPEGSGIIITKTGITSNYFMERLEILSVLSNPVNSTNVVSSNMIIREPNGVTFLDKLTTAAAMLGWKNLTEVRYYLGIYFNGWKQDGSPSTKISKSEWKIAFGSVGTEIDSTGSTYTINFTVENMAPLQTDERGVSRQKNVEVKETLEDTAKETGKALTKQFEHENTQNNPYKEPSVTHEVKLAKDIREQMFKMPINVASGTDTTPTASDQKHYNILFSGENINEALIKTVSDGIGVAPFLLPNMASDGTVDVSKGPSTNYPKLLVVHKDVDLVSHDPSTNSYNKKVTHTVGTYATPTLETMPPNASQQQMQAKAQSYISNGLLKKRYDYIFTGKNTEVIDAKLDFNNLYSMMIAMYQTDASKQPYATTEEYFNFETQSSSNRNLASTIGTSNQSSPTTPFNSGGRNMLMEEIGLNPNVLMSLKIKIAPIALPEKLRSGVGTNKEPTHMKQKAALAEHYGRGYMQRLFQHNGGTGEGTALFNISLSIRGDPFWIGTTNLDEVIDDPTKNRQDRANFTLGEHMFWFEFYTPATYDINTGLPLNVRNVMFSGVYKVNSLVSIFEGGKFTQTLEAIRDVTTLTANLNETSTVNTEGVGQGTGTQPNAPPTFPNQTTQPARPPEFPGGSNFVPTVNPTQPAPPIQGF